MNNFRVSGRTPLLCGASARVVLMGVFVVGAVAASATMAHAQTPEQKRAAKEHFEQARRLYDVGRYPEAIEAYQKAYLNVEDPVFLYNIAQSYRLNEQPEEAIRFYKNYLRRSPDAANRGEVEKKIEDLQKEMDAKARAAEPKVEPPSPVTTAPAPVTSPPAVTTTQPKATEPPAVTGPAPTMPPPEAKSGKWRTTGIILAGAGGTLLVTSVITGAMANKAAKDVEKGPIFDPDDEKRGKSLNTVAVVTGILGVLAGVGGGVLLLMGSGGSNDGDAGVAKQPQFALSPVVGGPYTGAEASFRF